MQRLQGKCGIVTGGSAGIGPAIVRRLTREGARILFCGTNRDRGLAAQQQLEPGQALFRQADVGEESEVEALIAATGEQFGRIDILVNKRDPGSGWPHSRPQHCPLAPQ